VSGAKIFQVRLTNLLAASMNASARMIMELNIKHYRGLLKTETDASKRQIISKLLAEEEAHLAELLARKDKD
jgi:rubrerythrin